MGQRLFDQPLLGAELAVETAVSHPGGLAQRVDARPGDATLPQKTRGRQEDAFAIFSRFLFGHAHVAGSEAEWVLTIIIAYAI